ncbi:MAG: hypothetical protein EA426_19480 [Spirochaetaceae bacterium]|nr:MAG: hypothetical protein EA426_19480 [Spirochaetaceae bacterium]
MPSAAAALSNVASSVYRVPIQERLVFFMNDTIDNSEGTRTGTGFGKLLLFGEHSAVYGYPALGVALPFATTVRLTFGRSPAGRRPTIDDPDRDAIMPIFDSLGTGVSIDHVEIASDVPRGVGFGSSASLTAAVARALLREADDTSVWDMANTLERSFHGTPSGIDTGLAVHGGACSFTFGLAAQLPRIEKLPIPPVTLVAAAVPRTGTTGELVGRIRKAVKNRDSETLESLAKLGEHATRGTQSFSRLAAGERAALTDLGAAADAAHVVLRKLGLSTDRLERCLDAGRARGALGGKLSGAGGGGAFFLIAPDAETGKSIAAAVSEAIDDSTETGARMARPYVFVFDESGIRLR